MTARPQDASPLPRESIQTTHRFLRSSPPFDAQSVGDLRRSGPKSYYGLVMFITTPLWVASFYIALSLLSQSNSLAAPTDAGQRWEEAEPLRSEELSSRELGAKEHPPREEGDWKHLSEESARGNSSTEQALDRELAARGLLPGGGNDESGEYEPSPLYEDDGVYVDRLPGEDGGPLFSDGDTSTGEYDAEPTSSHEHTRYESLGQ